MNKLYLRVKDLASQKKVSLAQIERDLNFSNGIISTWKNRNASQDKIDALADYFNVSTDYLLGRESKADMVHNMSVDEALGTIMSFEGKPVTDHDKKVMKDLLESYLRNKE